MVFRFATQILEDALFPVAFHLVPIINLTMPYRITDAISLLIGDGFITNMKVQVLYASFRPANSSLVLRCDRRRNNKLRVSITGVPHFSVSNCALERRDRKRILRVKSTLIHCQ